MEEPVVLYIPTEAKIRSIIKQELEDLFKKLVIYFKDMNEPEYLTVKQVSELLHISEITVRRQEKEGYLTAVRVGKRVMFKYEDIKNRLERRNHTKWRLAA